MGVDREGINHFWAAAKLAGSGDGESIEYFWAKVAPRYLSMQAKVPMNESAV